MKASGITRTALILVGRVFGAGAFADSRLYAADHHLLRPRRAPERIRVDESPKANLIDPDPL